jgi:hypothetical protein
VSQTVILSETSGNLAQDKHIIRGPLVTGPCAADGISSCSSWAPKPGLSFFETRAGQGFEGLRARFFPPKYYLKSWSHFQN